VMGEGSGKKPSRDRKDSIACITMDPPWGMMHAKCAHQRAMTTRSIGVFVSLSRSVTTRTEPIGSEEFCGLDENGVPTSLQYACSSALGVWPRSVIAPMAPLVEFPPWAAGVARDQ